MTKRIALLVLAAVMLCSFAACGENSGTTTTAPSTTAPSTTAPTAPNTTAPTASPTTPPEPTEPAPPELQEKTVAELLALKLEDGEVTEEFFLVKATVTSVTNANYGAMEITDGTGTISVYNSKDADGTYYSDMEDKPYKDDSVVLKCNVQNFNGTMEIKQAYIIEFRHAEIQIDPSEYPQMTIAQARETALGTKVQVSGVVACITYANGYIPDGVMLVDGTASIYVYDRDVAARCKVGNTVTICAEKAFWISESETGNAEKFGYPGCNQLDKAVLLSNDNGNTAFDTSWMETTTVKEILDTPCSSTFTTQIFKVTARVRKSEGTGFVNYYIDDLDGTTGSYTYTKCNGGDFGWLDEFDGKICTVYLTAINAKSTTSGCQWRFLPVAVVDEGFDPATYNFAEFAVKYHGLPQFLNFYSGNPELALLTSVDSELLGLSGAVLSYTSSDASVISIDDNVMNCHKTGTAVITITGSYNGVTYSEDVEIVVELPAEELQYPTVAEAINAEVGSVVTVQGIVGPSLVNQKGFYLIDETGVLAVRMDEETLATVSLGQKVVLEGTRYVKTKGGSDYFGQSCLDNAKVISNAFGSHDYSTATFATDMTAAQFYNLDATVDYSTTVFVMKATVRFEKYTVKLYDAEGNAITLYASGVGQYGWLQDYEGQEVTLEIAPCNWNDKTYWRGCVLAVVHEDGSKTVNTLNFDN